MPFFTVIVPVFNKARFLEKTLNSVMAQTFADFEVILVNDGSTDGSETVIRQFTDSRIRYYRQENQGVSVARNLGIRKAEAQYICFLDADDYWYPGFLETMHRYVTMLPGHKVFGMAFEHEISKKTFPAHYHIQKTGDYEIVDFFQSSTKEIVLWTSSACFHKDVFREAGDFDIHIRSGQDIDLWMRIGLIYPVVFIWEVQARYIYDSQSLSRNSKFLNQKFDFGKFSEAEKENKDVKYFLDLNRFSLAIKSKLIGDAASFDYYYNGIDHKNLPFKKRVSLTMPPTLLRALIGFKEMLARVGLGNSVFR